MVSTNVGMTCGRIGDRSLLFLFIEHITLYGSQVCVTNAINLTLRSIYTNSSDILIFS